ncbi:MAG TPA: hypothetical protein VII01_17610 [Solirubrobacteraceae bacterium]|jgi:hypothetical protein
MTSIPQSSQPSRSAERLLATERDGAIRTALGLLGLIKSRERAPTDVVALILAQALCITGIGLLLLGGGGGVAHDAGATMAIFGGISVGAECVRLLLQSRSR